MLVLGGFFLSSRTLVQIADAYGSDDQTANFQVWLKQNSTFGFLLLSNCNYVFHSLVSNLFDCYWYLCYLNLKTNVDKGNKH